MAGETILTIVGNLTADPELRTTGTGTQVCGFTIASTPRVWNRQANQYEDCQSLFMRCSAWRDLAWHCAQSLSKGMRRAIFDADLRAEMAEASWAGGQALPRWADRAAAFRAEIDKAFA